MGLEADSAEATANGAAMTSITIDAGAFPLALPALATVIEAALVEELGRAAGGWWTPCAARPRRTGRSAEGFEVVAIPGGARLQNAVPYVPYVHQRGVTVRALDELTAPAIEAEIRDVPQRAADSAARSDPMSEAMVSATNQDGLLEITDGANSYWLDLEPGDFSYQDGKGRDGRQPHAGPCCPLPGRARHEEGAESPFARAFTARLRSLYPTDEATLIDLIEWMASDDATDSHVAANWASTHPTPRRATVTPQVPPFRRLPRRARSDAVFDYCALRSAGGSEGQAPPPCPSLSPRASSSPARSSHAPYLPATSSSCSPCSCSPGGAV